MSFDPEDLYPLATPEGRAIPLEVIRPLGFVRIPTDAMVYTVPELTAFDVLLFWAEVDAYVRFDGSSAVPPTAGNFVSNRLFVPNINVIHRGVAMDVRNYLPDGTTPWDGSVSALDLAAGTGDIYITPISRYQALRSAVRVQSG